MKVAFLWFGMFFYLLAVVVEEVNRVDESLLETAYTLGRKPAAACCGSMFRASFPSIFSSFRILYDIGWTYVILAEMVNARKGVGYMVEAARKVLDFERVYAGIIAIGIAAFLFRSLARRCSKSRLFPVAADEPGLLAGGAAVEPESPSRPRRMENKVEDQRPQGEPQLPQPAGGDAFRRCGHQPRSGGRLLRRRPRHGRVSRAARALRLRKVHHSAHDRRPRSSRYRRSAGERKPVTGPGAIAAWFSRSTPRSPG